MLKQRIITAVILAPIFLALVAWAPYWLFSLGLLVVVGFAANEYLAMAKVGKQWMAKERLSYLVGFLVSALLLIVVPPLQIIGVILGGVFWLCQCINARTWKNLYGAFSRYQIALALIGLLCAYAAILSLHLQPQGAKLVLTVLLLVWGADIFAYFVGKRYGKRHLSPYISPGKTIEGRQGAMLGTGILGLVLGLVWFDGAQCLLIMVLALLVTWVSVVGDLAESRFKRQAGVKDSGSILPGHGGIVDRIDGLIAAAPVFAMLWMMLT